MAITAAQAQAAYLKIFDANDPRERSKLLNYVLTDAQTALLFMLNCSPNKIELEKAFEKIVDSPKHCHELMKKNINSLTPNQRMQALSSVIQDPNLAWDVVWGSKLNKNEKEIIYKTHYEHYLQDKTLDNYWAQWNAFGDIFPTEELQRFVDMIYECESFEAWDMAESLLKYGKLTEDQHEKLDSKIVARLLKN